MADPRAAVGASGERLVGADYEAEGYAIVETNWRCTVGEVDLVVRREGVLVFVEVRTVTTAFIGDPVVTVVAEKQRKVGRAADKYLRQVKPEWENIRFDVVSVVLGEGDPRIHRIENAFVPRWAY